jgi:hypothetical protein
MRGSWVPVAAAIVLATATAATACVATGIAPCPGTSAFDIRTGPLTRAEIDARIGTPGAPIADAVTQDVSRTWEAVRRRPAHPVIAYPAERAQTERKGETP